MNSVSRRQHPYARVASSAVRYGASLARRVADPMLRAALGSYRRNRWRRAALATARLAAPAAAAGTALAVGQRFAQMTPVNLFNNSPRTPRTRARQRARGSSSIYTGRMRKARKVKRDPFVQKGFKHVTEINGFVSDPDCVYVGHAADAAYDMIEIAVQSLLRKLFEKAGLVVTSVNDPLFFNSGNSCQGWRIRINRIHPETGAITGFDYDTGINESIGTIAGEKSGSVPANFGSLLAVMFDYAQGQIGQQIVNVLEPLNLVLFADVGDGIYQQVSQLNLREEHVVFSVVSTIKVQNRSLAASGSEDAESVSANTLRMVKYIFDGAPRQRDKTAMIGLPVEPTGVLTTGATVGGNVYMREPVSPKLFWNCKRTTGGHLNPGEMKSDTIKWKKSMKLLAFLRYVGYRPSNVVGGVTYTNAIKGPFGMYAFEDMINVNSTESITVAYEVNRSIGLYCTTKKVRFATGGVYSLTQDSAPPPPP